MNFSIIIPNFNGDKLLESCLESIVEAIKFSPKNKFEIILVDNNSQDLSLKTFSKFTKIISTKVIALKSNLGFGQAVNQGVVVASFPYIVTINNDLKLQKNWFIQIESAIRKYPSYSAFYGLVLNKTGSKIESAGFKFYPRGSVENIDNGKIFQNSNLKLHKPKLIWGAPASLIVYQKNIFQRLNGFDPRFFAFIEDVDFSYRLNQSNFKTLFVPTAISYHQGGATANLRPLLRPYMTFKNWIIFIGKNYPFLKILKYFPSIFIERLRNLSYLFREILKYLLKLAKI